MFLIKAMKYMQKQNRFSGFEAFVFRHMRAKESVKCQSERPIVVIQCVEDYYYFLMWGAFIQVMKETRDFSVHQIVPSGFVVGESSTLGFWLRARLFRNRLFDRKWVRLFGSYVDKLAFRQSEVGDTLFHLYEAISAALILRKIKSREQLLELKLSGIGVGDLIYDTYLRFKPAPTVDVRNIYLFIVIWRALQLVRKSKRYFERVRPAIFLTSYTTYVQHGIPARVALENGVSVFSFGNFGELFKKVSAKDPYHSKNASLYAIRFETLTGISAKLAAADEALRARISGKIDLSTFYMKRSAYAENAETPPDLSGKMVMFLHDFFDSPHIYGELLFPDFWVWATTTIDLLLQYQIPFAVKPHPNQSDEARASLHRLMEKYPTVQFISSGFSNRQLVEAGMMAALTVYGSIAHEMAYLGVPTLACGENPHSSFSFCKSAQTVEEYIYFLTHFEALKFPLAEEMKKEALVFYYMHNLDCSSEELQVRHLMLHLRQAVEKTSALADSSNWTEIQSIVDQLTHLFRSLNVTESVWPLPHNH